MNLVPKPVLLFLLLFFCNNSFLFSADLSTSKSERDDSYIDISLVDKDFTEKYTPFFRSTEKNNFKTESFHSREYLRHNFPIHDVTSRKNNTRSRFAFPTFGVKEMIYPFHGFL